MMLLVPQNLLFGDYLSTLGAFTAHCYMVQLFNVADFFAVTTLYCGFVQHRLAPLGPQTWADHFSMKSRVEI